MPDFRLFLKHLRALAAIDGVPLHFQVHRWPTPQPLSETVEGPGESPGEAFAYSYLDDDAYRADFALCFAHHPCELGPEIAHLLHGRENWVHHLLIVTRIRLADGLRYGFTAVMPSSFRPEGRALFEPVGCDSSGDDCISFFDTPSMYSEASNQRIRAILVN